MFQGSRSVFSNQKQCKSLQSDCLMFGVESNMIHSQGEPGTRGPSGRPGQFGPGGNTGAAGAKGHKGLQGHTVSNPLEFYDCQ